MKLRADFEKRFDRNIIVRGEIVLPLDNFSVTVLFGPSGCGKTTILRCLAGLERLDSGEIMAGNEAWADTARRVHRRPQARSVGYMSQDYALFPHLTVNENVAFGLSKTNDHRNRVLDLLATLHIEELGSRYPRELSGGQQQRVALARAMARRPRLLLLDEPLSALDAPTRDLLRRDLRAWLAAFKTPTVIVTHDRAEALALADSVVVMDQGRVIQNGPTAEVFSKPASVSVAKILGTDTVVEAHVEQVRDGVVTLVLGAVRLTAIASEIDEGESAFACIRGEDVVLQSRRIDGSSARNCLEGVIISVLSEGPLTRVRLDCGFELTSLVTRPAAEELGLAPGGRIVAIIKAPSIHVISRGRA